MNAGFRTSAVQLYDAATLAPIGVPLPSPGAAASWLAASPEDNAVAAGTSNGYVALWDIDIAHWEQMACAIAGRNLSRAEWQQYLPDQPYHVTCPQWPSGT